MKRLIVSLLLVAAMAGPAAAEDFVFETVDEFEHRNDRLTFRGVLQGQTEPVDLLVSWFDEPLGQTASCERMALMAMARPGRYLLLVNTTREFNVELLNFCRLIRR